MPSTLQLTVQFAVAVTVYEPFGSDGFAYTCPHVGEAEPAFDDAVNGVMDVQVTRDPSPRLNAVEVSRAPSRKVRPSDDTLVARDRGPAVINHTGNPTANIFHSLLFGSGPKIGVASGSRNRTTSDRANASKSKEGVTGRTGPRGHSTHRFLPMIKNAPLRSSSLTPRNKQKRRGSDVEERLMTVLSRSTSRLFFLQ